MWWSLGGRRSVTVGAALFIGLFCVILIQQYEAQVELHSKLQRQAIVIEEQRLMIEAQQEGKRITRERETARALLQPPRMSEDQARITLWDSEKYGPPPTEVLDDGTVRIQPALLRESRRRRLTSTNNGAGRTAATTAIKKTERKHAIVTFYCGNGPEYVRVAMDNKRKYATRHGYHLVDLSDDPRVCKLNAFMARYTAMKIVLDDQALNVEGVMWADVDALFINFNRTLDEAMDSRFDLFITAGSPHSNRYAKFSNNGHVYLRNTPWGHDVIDELVQLGGERCRDIVHSDQVQTHINWLKICNSDGSWGMNDQGLIMVVVRNHTDPKWTCHVMHVPFRTFNSEFPWYRSGDLVIHFPGRSGANRLDLFRKFLSATNLDTGFVDYEKEPELRPANDQDLLGFDDDMAAVRAMYDQWYAQH